MGAHPKRTTSRVEPRMPLERQAAHRAEWPSSVGRDRFGEQRKTELHGQHECLPLGRRARSVMDTTANGGLVLFDGGFARTLVELGRRDVLRRAREVQAFFCDTP